MLETMALGIDTGGTYTDAVLYDEQRASILARAKAPTTHHDLSIGIRQAIDGVLDSLPADDLSRISLVSLSTTLATNALVEGLGRPVAAIIIGLEPEALGRGGLGEALGGDPVFFIDGGHDVHGEEITSLDPAGLEQALEAIAKSAAEAVAITAQFSVRNPAHELAAQRIVVDRLGLPVSCSHELAEALNGPRRAVTTILNARLVSVIAELVEAASRLLIERTIDAPLMIVRGDGSLVSAEFARQRPIETILSGPAASLVGAAHLAGVAEALVVDVGGTTTDVAMLHEGRPAVSAEGARVGGHQTMVRSVAMRTEGLGGDSEVAPDDRRRGLSLQLGPRRIVPLALLDAQQAALGRAGSVVASLQRQRRLATASDLDAIFLVAGPRSADVSSLTANEEGLMALVRDGPILARDALVSSVLRRSAERLVQRGLLQRSAFSPTDAALILGLQHHLGPDASIEGAELLARRKDGVGSRVAADGIAVAQATVDAFVRRSGESIVGAAMSADGLPENSVDLTIVQRSLDRSLRHVVMPVTLAIPVVALGASAASLYPLVGDLIGAQVIVPDDADVANAIGAVVGRVTISHRAEIAAPEPDRLVVHAGGVPAWFSDLDSALAAARLSLLARLADDLPEAGAPDYEVSEHWSALTAQIGGSEMFVSGTLTLTASGRPSRAIPHEVAPSGSANPVN